MRCPKPLISALIVLLISIGAPSLASATSVVDQYTEQIPGPGGPEISKPDGQGNAGPDVIPSSAGAPVAPAGASDTSPAIEEPPSTGSGIAANSQGSRTGGPVGAKPSGPVIASTGGEDGLGWLFPGGIILVGAAVAAIVIGRHRGTRPI